MIPKSLLTEQSGIFFLLKICGNRVQIVSSVVFIYIWQGAKGNESIQLTDVDVFASTAVLNGDILPL